jgi:hypothetical protein
MTKHSVSTLQRMIRTHQRQLRNMKTRRVQGLPPPPLYTTHRPTPLTIPATSESSDIVSCDSDHGVATPRTPPNSPSSPSSDGYKSTKERVATPRPKRLPAYARRSVPLRRARLASPTSAPLPPAGSHTHTHTRCIFLNTTQHTHTNTHARARVVFF